MTSPTEQEIVARAIKALVPMGYGMTMGEAIDYAKASIAALDQYRAKNAGEVEKFLRDEAQKYARALQMMQEFRTADYKARGDLDANYRSDVKPEDTQFWKAANLISTLRSAIAEKDEALRLLEVGVYPIKGSQPIHDPTQLHAWDLGCKDAREMVSAIAARARSRISDGVK